MKNEHDSIVGSEKAGIIARAWQQLTMFQSLADVCDSLALLAVDITGAEFGSVALREGNKLVFHGSSRKNEATKKIFMDLGTGIPGKVALDGSVRRSPASGIFSEPEKEGTIICAPVVRKATILGTVQVFNKRGKENFSQDDENALLLLCELAGYFIEKLRSEHALAAESGRLKGIFEAITDGILVVDPAGNPLMYNKAVEEMFFPEGRQNYALTTYILSLISEAACSNTSEAVLLKPHGHVLSNRSVTIRDEKGNPREIVLSLRNVSDLRAQNRRFFQFYAIALNRMRRLMRESGTIRKNARLLRKNAGFQNELLNRMLKLLALASGPLRINRQRSDLIGIYAKVREKCLPKLKRLGISLHDEQITGVHPIEGRFDEIHLAKLFRIIFRVASKSLSAKSRIVFMPLKLSEDSISFEINLTNFREDRMLDSSVFEWERALDDDISFARQSISIEMAYAQHILRAHNGRISISPASEGSTAISISITISRT